MFWEAERAAFEGRLSANFDTLPIQYSGVPFTPPQNSGWVRFQILPGPNRRITLGPNAVFRQTGMVVLSIFTLPNRGSNEAREVADELFSVFHEAEFTHPSAGTIVCRAGSIDDRGITTDMRWYQVNLTVEYHRDLVLA